MNQTIKIVFWHFFTHMKDSKKWHEVLSMMQLTLNSAQSTMIRTSSHELMYDFKLSIMLNFSMTLSTTLSFNLQLDTEEAINFAVMIMKKHYDKIHKFKFFKSDDKVYLKLHKKYIIALMKILRKKFTQ